MRPDGGVVVHGLVPGGAAERDGLMRGDVLLTANGSVLRDPIMATLAPLLQKDDPIAFEIERAGRRSVVKVKPNPRS
jgi:S1-C subfamily serine protease